MVFHSTGPVLPGYSAHMNNISLRSDCKTMRRWRDEMRSVRNTFVGVGARAVFLTRGTQLGLKTGTFTRVNFRLMKKIIIRFSGFLQIPSIEQ